MLVPPQNILVFRGFGYAFVDGKSPEDETVTILNVLDKSGLNVAFIFSQEEFKVFQDKAHARMTVDQVVPKTT
jgi:hypothetical protein